jgi:hypothetical protein
MGKVKNESENNSTLKWYHYAAIFFGAFLLTNAAPHFLNGASGNPFPSPFADPPGKGLSSPLVNVLWGSFNLLLGYILLRAGKTSTRNKLSMLILFIAIVAAGIMLAISFTDKIKI